MIALIERVKPKVVINVALPYQDLHIMDACLATGVDYLDTANYEPLDEAKFEYKWQWAYQERFKEKGIMALLGSGFDPGVTNVYTAWLHKHEFDEIETLDIVDANAGNHGQPFATNFNPEINIREVTREGRYWENNYLEKDRTPVRQAQFRFPGGHRPDEHLPPVPRGAGVHRQALPEAEARALLDDLLAELPEPPAQSSATSA